MIPAIVRKTARTTLGAIAGAKEQLRTKVLFPPLYERYARDGRRIIFPALHYWRVEQNFDSILLVNNSYSVLNPLCTLPARLKWRIYNAAGLEITRLEREIEPFGTIAQRLSETAGVKGHGVMTATLLPPVDFFEHRKAGFDRREYHKTTAYMGYEIGRNISYVHNIETAYIGDSLPDNPFVQSVLAPYRSPRPVFMPNLSLPLDEMEYIEVITINSSNRRRRLMARVLVDGHVRAESRKTAAPLELLSLRYVPHEDERKLFLRLETFLATGNAKPYFIVKYRGHEATFHHS
jgi:hypothetical protein